MSVFKCPGSDIIRYPQPETVTCSACGRKVEIWSDEEEADCPGCGRTVSRRMPPSCWEWCSCARECIGSAKYNRLKKGREERGTEEIKPQDTEGEK